MIKSADFIIDLGPEGGANGGRVVASGTPEEVAAVRRSHTGHVLKPLLNSNAKRNGSKKVEPAALASFREESKKVA